MDTSALLALVNLDDRAHTVAVSVFDGLERSRALLVTTSYVLLETYALLQRRKGIDAVTGFREQVAPLLRCEWVGEALHNAGLSLLVERQARRLSLVDAVSFVYMREQRIFEAFAYDADFAAEGYGAPDVK